MAVIVSKGLQYNRLIGLKFYVIDYLHTTSHKAHAMDSALFRFETVLPFPNSKDALSEDNQKRHNGNSLA